MISQARKWILRPPGTSFLKKLFSGCKLLRGVNCISCSYHVLHMADSCAPSPAEGRGWMYLGSLSFYSPTDHRHSSSGRKWTKCKNKLLVQPYGISGILHWVIWELALSTKRWTNEFENFKQGELFRFLVSCTHCKITLNRFSLFRWFPDCQRLPFRSSAHDVLSPLSNVVWNFVVFCCIKLCPRIILLFNTPT